MALHAFLEHPGLPAAIRDIPPARPAAHPVISALSIVAARAARFWGSLWSDGPSAGATPRRSNPGHDVVAAGSHRFSLVAHAKGGWALNCAETGKSAEFDDLASALMFARAEAEDEPADIELLVDGLYIFIHQPKGWPHAVCAPTRSSDH